MTCLEKFKDARTDLDEKHIIELYCPDGSGGIDITKPPYCDDGCDLQKCRECWNREIPEPEAPHIKDSGNRTEFATGAVRDIQEGKGRCDLLPLDVVAWVLGGCDDDKDVVLDSVAQFVTTNISAYLYDALEYFRNLWGVDFPTLFLEVAIHFEEGAKKYGERNWEKGIPVQRYIDSAVRHYLKFLRGDKDEPHDRAFCWNIMCAIWTCKHKPELNDYAHQNDEPPGQTSIFEGLAR